MITSGIHHSYLNSISDAARDYVDWAIRTNNEEKVYISAADLKKSAYSTDMRLFFAEVALGLRIYRSL